MIFQFNERPESRSYSHKTPSYTLVYLATGETNDLTVQSYAIGATSAYVSTAAGTLYRQDVKLQPRGYAAFLVTVPYGKLQSETGQYTFDFDTGGATVNMKTGKEHISSWDEVGQIGGGGIPNTFHNGAIGVTKDGDIEGVDIVIPALKLNVRFQHPQGVITMAQVKALAGITGTVNSRAFLTFDPGELLYVGSSGSDGSDTDASVSYGFVAIANATVDFGDIKSIIKKGHHYAWAEHQDGVEDGVPVVTTIRAHVERVYEEVDWVGVFGWS